MHEYGIACEIGEAVVAEMGRHGASRALRVSVSVGVLRGIVAEHLRFFFEHAVRGTPAEGAALAVEEEPVTVLCSACGESSSPRFTLECPRCGGPAAGSRGGDALRLTAIEIED